MCFGNGKIKRFEVRSVGTSNLFAGFGSLSLSSIPKCKKTSGRNEEVIVVVGGYGMESVYNINVG